MALSSVYLFHVCSSFWPLKTVMRIDAFAQACKLAIQAVVKRTGDKSHIP